MPRDLNQKILNAVEDSTIFPILTEEVQLAAAPAAPRVPGVVPSPGAAPLGQIVEGTIRQVLGWRPKPGDTKGFLSALNQSFSLQEIEGHIESTWTPRSYAAETPADLGALTGAQASIYTRAKTALDQSLPLLAGLRMLDVSKDPDDAEATRAIVRSEMSELVGWLGAEGGPPVARVDQLFIFLGTKPGAKPLDLAAGQLRTLADRFGLEPGNVNTIDEEQNLTNFLVIADYFNSLMASWNAVKSYFTVDLANITKPTFLGTQLVLIARALEVVGESIQEINFVMDSVFLGQAERQTILLKFEAKPPDIDEKPPLFFTDLMNLVLSAAQEGPKLFQDAGKDGVAAFTPTVKDLHTLVRRAMMRSPQNAGGQSPKDRDIPAGYRAPRVQAAMQELVGRLNEVYKLARQITRAENPKILVFEYHPEPYLAAALAAPVSPISMKVYGNNFDPTVTIRLVRSAGGGPIDIPIVPTYVNPGFLHVRQHPLPRIPAGAIYDVRIENKAGGSDEAPGAFSVI